jgi:hypothetical protein
MSQDHARFEGYIAGNDHPQWNQSFYYQFYDPKTRTGALIRIGLLENQQQANTWFIVFRDGRPLFTRTNMNLPYTKTRPADGLELAGMRVHAVVPLKQTRITLASPDFSADFTWNEWAPMEDCIAKTHDAGSFASEIAHIHLEGTSKVTGHIVHRGERSEVDGIGFRDVAAGPRNWDGLLHYRLAWPVFENGTALAGIHGFSTGGQSAYMKMYYDGSRWLKVGELHDQMVYADDGLSAKSAAWSFTDETGKVHAFTARPLFHWLFPLDTFVLCEQVMEYRKSDGTVGYGLYETGYRLPWKGLAG